MLTIFKNRPMEILCINIKLENLTYWENKQPQSMSKSGEQTKQNWPGLTYSSGFFLSFLMFDFSFFHTVIIYDPKNHDYGCKQLTTPGRFCFYLGTGSISFDSKSSHTNAVPNVKMKIIYFTPWYVGARSVPPVVEFIFLFVRHFVTNNSVPSFFGNWAPKNKNTGWASAMSGHVWRWKTWN